MEWRGRESDLLVYGEVTRVSGEGEGKDVGRRSVEGLGKRDRVTVRVCDGAS